MRLSCRGVSSVFFGNAAGFILPRNYILEIKILLKYGIFRENPGFTAFRHYSSPYCDRSIYDLQPLKHCLSHSTTK